MDSFVDFMDAMKKLGADVVRDMPNATTKERLREAMRRNKGSMHPRLVEEAILWAAGNPPRPLIDAASGLKSGQEP
jgi:hypothetical protein